MDVLLRTNLLMIVYKCLNCGSNFIFTYIKFCIHTFVFMKRDSDRKTLEHLNKQIQHSAIADSLEWKS